MSDATNTDGPALAETVREVQGHFPNDAMLQNAIAQLELKGFDRADLSLPHAVAAGVEVTPEDSADNPIDETDRSQLRTMGTGMAGYAGAAAAAAATLATGGAAALAIAAAAAVGAGAALTANAAGRTVDRVATEERDELGRAGRLILAARVREAGQTETAASIMRAAGATDVEEVTRSDGPAQGGVDASSWTGG